MRRVVVTGIGMLSPMGRGVDVTWQGIINGKVVDESECTVSVLDRAFQYSYSVYEALKRKNNKFVHLDEHLKRLNLSAEAIGIENPFSDEELSAWLELLARTEDLENATFRILLFGSDDVKVFINHSSIKVYPDVYYSDGVDVVTYHAERYLPNVKTSNMLPSLLALMSAEKRSAFEALMVDRNNLVLEGTRSNFYGIKDNVIRTAPDDMVLLGVTRLGLIKAAEKYGIRIEEKALSLDELYSMDSLFLTSTSMKAIPIRSVDGKKVSKRAHETVLALSEFIGEWE